MSLDANCRFCGEPWDIYEFHDFPNYNKAVKAFQKYGCGMFNADPDDLDSASKCSNPVINPQLAAIAGALQELSDHPDEWMDAEQYL